jgi:hypothetical protein
MMCLRGDVKGGASSACRGRGPGANLGGIQQKVIYGASQAYFSNWYFRKYFRAYFRRYLRS